MMVLLQTVTFRYIKFGNYRKDFRLFAKGENKSSKRITIVKLSAIESNLSFFLRVLSLLLIITINLHPQLLII